MNTLFGQKLTMSQKFDEQGNRVSVTGVALGPCTVLQIKTVEHDGYNALQLGWGEKRTETKPLLGHIGKAKVEKTPAYIAEIRVEDVSKYKAGDVIKAEEVFKKGDDVKVIGISKGKGFAGGVKRYGFKGGPKTHGQADRQRAPGSVGQSTTPGRVYRGKRMAGNMGNDRITLEGVSIFDIDIEKNIVYLNGPIPGATKGMITISKQG